jgi:deoxycytidylate deaminase
MATVAASNVTKIENTSRSIEAVTLSERRSPELVIAVVGAIGSGVSKCVEILTNRLSSEYGYTVSVIKASQKIIASARLVGEEYEPSLKGGERIDRLQTIGNKLRQKLSNNYIIEKCVEEIALARTKDGYKKAEGGALVAIPRRYAHIIDSVKHPEEVKLLREVYGDLFWLVAVFATADVRETRLKAIGVKPEDISKIFARDENEDFGYGQKVRDTTHLADFFVRNDGQNDIRLSSAIDRYLEIVFNIRVHTPTSHEAAMYAAAAAAAKSACLSRQVGAAIYSKEGELVGVGWNDVAKAFGGLYSADDGESDHRCFRWGQKICHNDDRKERLYGKIFEALGKNGVLQTGATEERIRSALRDTDIRNLIEYSRSVHAEMEAIISAARQGKGGLVQGKLYSTTFPCHSCARHIVASGISEVYYIEPYSKSLALDLHGDSVSTDIDKHETRVVFLQYEGVAPKNVVKLFRNGASRKANGKSIEQTKKDAEPVSCPVMDGFTTYEQVIVSDIKAKEDQLAGKPQPSGGTAA